MPRSSYILTVRLHRYYRAAADWYAASQAPRPQQTCRFRSERDLWRVLMIGAVAAVCAAEFILCVL